MRFDIPATKKCICGAEVEFGLDDYYVYCPKCGERHSKIHTIIGQTIGDDYHTIDNHIRLHAKSKVINKEFYVISEKILKDKLGRIWFDYSKVTLTDMLGSDAFDEYYLEYKYHSATIGYDEKDKKYEIRRNMERETWDMNMPFSAYDIFIDEKEFNYKTRSIVRNDTGVVFGRIVPKVIYDAVNEIVENATLKTVPDALNEIEKIIKELK